MSARTWMKEPCGPCPYSRSKTLWLHPERAEEFAYNASNPDSDFPCHKTAVCVDDGDGGEEFVAGERSLTCSGFLSLQVAENGNGPEGFESHPDAFSECYEMIDHHTEHWEDEHRIPELLEQSRQADERCVSIIENELPAIRSEMDAAFGEEVR